MSQELKRARKKLLEGIAKSSPIIISAVTTPFAIGYLLLADFLTAMTTSAYDEYADERKRDFVENDILLRAWRYPVIKLLETIDEYKQTKRKILNY